jgi:integrase
MNDQLFNISRFDGTRKVQSDNMDHPPLRAFFRRLSKECGFTVSPHRFRHTLATNLMAQPDRNIKMAQVLLGHSTPAVTLEYVEADLNRVRMMLEDMEAA